MKVCLKPIEDDIYEVIDCDSKEPIDFGKNQKNQRRNKTPSDYNIFMGSCLKSKSGDIKSRFKNCVDEWKRKKE